MSWAPVMEDLTPCQLGRAWRIIYHIERVWLRGVEDEVNRLLFRDASLALVSDRRFCAFSGAEDDQVALLWNQHQSEVSLYWYGQLVHSMHRLAQRWEGHHADSITSCIALGIVDSPLLGSVHPSAWGPRECLLSVVPRTHEQSIEMVLAIEGAEGVTGHLPRGRKRSAAESELPADSGS